MINPSRVSHFVVAGIVLIRYQSSGHAHVEGLPLVVAASPRLLSQGKVVPSFPPFIS
jgi:hypothetical protein